MNSERKKNIANIAAGTIIITAKAAARFLLAKMRNGISGCSTRDSIEQEERRAGRHRATRLAMVLVASQP